MAFNFLTMGKIKKLINYTCELGNIEIWGIVAGFGSYFYLHMGEKILRDKPILNDKLHPFLREYHGFYRFGVRCAWRLEKKGKVILSHIQDEAKHITPKLAQLKEQKILHIDEIPNNVGLSIHMTNDLVLTLFYDSVDDYNWVLFKNNEFYCGVKRLRFKFGEIAKE